MNKTIEYLQSEKVKACLENYKRIGTVIRRERCEQRFEPRLVTDDALLDASDTLDTRAYQLGLEVATEYNERLGLWIMRYEELGVYQTYTGTMAECLVQMGRIR